MVQAAEVEHGIEGVVGKSKRGDAHHPIGGVGLAIMLAGNPDHAFVKIDGRQTPRIKVLLDEAGGGAGASCRHHQWPASG